MAMNPSPLFYQSGSNRAKFKTKTKRNAVLYCFEFRGDLYVESDGLENQRAAKALCWESMQEEMMTLFYLYISIEQENITINKMKKAPFHVCSLLHTDLSLENEIFDGTE